MTPAGRGRGPGRAGLIELAGLLSGRDFAVIDELHRYRFLTTGHIERLLFHDHASAGTAARTCRRTLVRLADFRLVERLPRRVGGVHAGSAATVWALSSTGARLRALRRGEGAVARFREPSVRFIGHLLAIADAMVAVTDATRTGRFELARAQLEPDCWRPYLGPSGERLRLEPDLYLVTASGDWEDHWFVEVDTGSEHPTTVLRKCRDYETYRASGSEQQGSGVFPRVLWTVPNQAREDKLRAAINASRLDKHLYTLTTPQRLVDTLASGGQA